MNKLVFQGRWWGIPRLKGKKNEVVQKLRGALGIKGISERVWREVLEILGRRFYWGDD